MIELSKRDFLSSGSGRDIYLHPQDTSKIIKITKKGVSKRRDQNELEYLYYSHLQKLNTPQTHIATCYGFIQTNLGKGLVFERILNYDGSSSITLKEILLVKKFTKNMEDNLILDLKEFIFTNEILFVDIASTNVLCQEYKKDSFRLIIIDGLAGSSMNLKFYFALRVRLYRDMLIKKRFLKFMQNVEIKIKEREICDT